jgi:peptide/nickel transport system substrate-binding protein
MRRLARLWLPPLAAALSLVSCSSAPQNDSGTVNFLIESMPASLDPRVGTDAQSERIDGLLFNSLVERDAQMNPRGDLADRWETPDPLTYVFHLHPGVYFHDGKPLTSADVKFTFDSIRSGAIATQKRGSYRLVSSIDAPDPQTVIFHLSTADASFLWNLSRPAVGIVPAGSGADFAAHPVGTGPFRFVSAEQDEDVVIERNPTYFRIAPIIQRTRFRIVPDAIVRALELRKGTGDLESSSLPADMVAALAKDAALSVTEQPGTVCTYIAINFEDPALGRREVRQALAYATDRESIVRYLLHGEARIADGILAPNSWAYEPNVMRYTFDPARAEQLLDAAGFPRRPELANMRLHLGLKLSTDEATRLYATVLQDQWRRVGIDLELRSLETATLLSDVGKGNFQLYTLRWIGANNDPDIFQFVFSSSRIPPNGANRGRYRNPKLDMLVDQARVEPDREKRRALFSEVQRIVAEDLPYLNLWFTDNVSVHSKRIENIALAPADDYDFLSGITLRKDTP